MLDGASRLDDLFAEASQQGMTSIAMTDHGNLFGAYDFDVDKKSVIFEKVCDLEPQVIWLYDKHNKLKKENYDMSDSYTCGLAYFNLGFKTPLKS